MATAELVVMAAGVGSRFGGMKQVEPVGPGGEFLMDYAVWDAARAGVERAVFVIRRDMERDFHARRGGRYARLLDVAYAFQEVADVPAGFQVPAVRRKPWGTAHAVLAAREAVTAPFVVINADDFYGAAGLAELLEFLGREQEEVAMRSGACAIERYALVTYELANTLSAHGGVARGVCEVGEDGTLRGIAEHTDVRQDAGEIRGITPDGSVRRFTGREPVSMNLWGFRPSVFPHLEERFAAFLTDRGDDPSAELYLPSVIDHLIQQSKATVQVLHTPDAWFGLTYRQDHAHAAARIRSLISEGVYPPSLWD